MRGRKPIRHADRVQAAVDGDAPARSALAASWRRSAALHRLDPAGRAPPRRLSDAELSLARQRVERLLHAAQASLDRLYQAVGGVGCCVLLADRDGVPVDRRGAAADDATFRDWGLWTGAVWSEAAEGTNAIGTAIVEQRGLTIHRDQHFFTRNTALSCTTAPSSTTKAASPPRSTSLHAAPTSPRPSSASSPSPSRTPPAASRPKPSASPSRTPASWWRRVPSGPAAA